MKTAIRLLNDNELAAVHSDSLKILAEVGVIFHSAKARQILSRAGARVDEDRNMVFFPAEMVEAALATSPRSFTLGARNPDYDIHLPSPVTMFGLDGQATFTLDFQTGERREGRLSDIAYSCRLLQTLPQGGFFWPSVKAHDVPLASMLFNELCTALSHTSKHAQHEVHHSGQIPYLLQILEAVAGSADEVRRRKLFSIVYCTLPPLRHDAEMCEAYLELLDYEIPILVLPMNAPGSTGPASLRSNLALANAEALSAICLFQTAKPGTPMIYAASQGGTNFADGGFMTGSVEAAMLNAAAVEMARHYGLPCAASGCTSEAKFPGDQVMVEKMQSLLPAFLAGPDLFVGLGEMDSAQLLVLEQVLMDYELVRHCQRLKDGIDFSESKNFFADIHKVGAGGNFFALPRTAKMCRSAEFLPAGLSHKGSYDNWLKAGSPGLRSRARQRVEEILAAPLADPLPDKVLETLETILARMAEDKSLA